MADAIFHEHQRNVNKLMEANLTLNTQYAEDLYWESVGVAPLTYKYVRGHFLVFENKFKELPTQLRELHEYYMAQALETDEFGFVYIIRSPLLYN
jgi:hypothetical protein